MKIIYEPRGAAREYAELALNHYLGCTHQCSYCYVPNTLHISKEDYFGEPAMREGIIAKVASDAKYLADNGCDSEILLSFIGDPYQPCETELGLTRQIIEILMRYNLRFTVLTKGGTRACRDFDLFEKYEKCSFGTSLVFSHNDSATKYEPNAASVSDRQDAVMEASKRGIKTWVSMEPVIIPEEALDVLVFLGKDVDFWKIGKINHNKELESRVDWAGFREEAKRILDNMDAKYYIKRSLSEL